MKKHRPRNARKDNKVKFLQPKMLVSISESDPGLQNVHRWRHKDDKRAQCSLENQQQLIRFISIMILPQVHLRKPCYDFYFL